MSYNNNMFNRNNRIVEGYFNASSPTVEDKYLAEYQQFAKPHSQQYHLYEKNSS